MRIPLFMTEPHPCPYLPGQQARNAVAEAQWSRNMHVASELNRQGFRRSGEFLYRPQCETCSACQALRIDVNAFLPSRSQRRLLRRNDDLRIVELGSIDNDACFELFRHYINARHAGGSMHPARREDYQRFLARPPSTATGYFGVADTEQRLIAVLVYDRLDDGLSDVFSFYDVGEARRSLGTWMILASIQRARDLQLAYVYPGFYIESCPKMTYKSRFSAMEILRHEGWQPFAASAL
jgi:arginine-tRNA-protein transferase